jgi:alpha-tubulin suppressor-like RCC1 family protein
MASVERKAPYRKKKTLSPQAFKEFLEEENISGYPADIKNIKISCSYTYCSAVTASKNVISWGDENYSNFEGQLRVPKLDFNVIDIATCYGYTYALLEDGTLVGWGDQSRPYYKAPVTKGIKRITGNGEFFLALTGDNNLVGWGRTPSFNVRSIPEEAYFESPIVDIAVGYNHAVILKENGQIISWGAEGVQFFNKNDNQYKVVKIDAYNEFTLGLTEVGTLVGWGTTRYGQQNIPKELQIPGYSKVISFAVGQYHCCVITENGKVHVWGWDIQPGDKIIGPYMYGKEGEMDRKHVFDPKVQKYLIQPPDEVLYLQDEKPLRIYAGKDVCFVLMSSGDVIGWGDEEYKLLEVPEVIPPLTRPGQPNLDLSPYGIKLTIDEVIQGKFDTNYKFLAPLIKANEKYIQTTKGTYKLGQFLGKGAYGEVYNLDYNGTTAACKIFNLRSRQEIPGIIQEAMFNIIIENEAKRLGYEDKLCPAIFEFAYNGDKTLYLIQEKLDIALYKIIEKKLVNEQLADLIVQIAEKLNWLYDHLEFNHRDFKSDNIMIKYRQDGTPEIVFIDFGFCCMTYRGIRIKVSPYFSKKPKCFLETRDMTFLFHELYTSPSTSPYMPREVGYMMKQMLRFKVKGQACDLAGGLCEGKKNVWPSIYDTLNVSYLYNPNVTTDMVIEKFSKFLR